MPVATSRSPVFFVFSYFRAFVMNGTGPDTRLAMAPPVLGLALLVGCRRAAVLEARPPAPPDA